MNRNRSENIISSSNNNNEKLLSYNSSLLPNDELKINNSINIIPIKKEFNIKIENK